MSKIIFIVGVLLSSMVSVSIMFDFMDKLFERVYKNKRIYILTKLLFILLLAGINALENSWFNLFCVLIISEIIVWKLYSGIVSKRLLYIVIITICISACESIGIVILHYTYQLMEVEIQSVRMRSLFDLTITQIVVILINHVVILQIMRKKKISELTNQQYLYTIIYAIFSIINLYVLSILISASSTASELVFITITIIGIVIINTHFLKILEFASENNRLQYENNLFLQQSRMQYQYYDNLELQYRESLNLLHDVKKHIRTIEELYHQEENETAAVYSLKICNQLDSFKINEYTDNRVLNIILNDKIKMSEQNNIEFTCKIEELDLSFIDDVDLTTIFANLLDNAIEACLEIDGEKSIAVQVGSFNNLVVIYIKNTMNKTISDIGLNMKSNKKNHSGIGLPNVIKVINKYNGDFNIQREGNMFVCSIVLSKQGRQEM